MTEGPEPGFAVWHYDGRAATRHEVRLVPDDGAKGFRLVWPDGSETAHRFADLEPREGVAGDTVFGHRRTPGWRIGFVGDVPASLTGMLPRKGSYGGIIDRFGLWPAVAVFALIAAGVVFAIVNSPSVLARAVPRAWENRIGELMVGDLGGRACEGPGGQAALEKLVARVSPASAQPGDQAVKVSVVNIGMVNAVTLPGGRIVVFNGLLEKASGPDEVAGVLGHEIGHVENRDVMESLLRQLGLTVLLGGLDGNVGGFTSSLLSASYSRGAESRADDFAIAQLGKARISPLPTAAFFQKLGGDDKVDARIKRVGNYMSSHPISEDRAKAFRSSARKDAGYTPALSAADWQALRAICSSDKDAKVIDLRF